MTSFCTATFPFVGQEAGDLSFEMGQDIQILSKDDSGWWNGKNLKTGQVGDFPFNYVKEISVQEYMNKMKGQMMNKGGSDSEDIKKITVNPVPNSLNFEVVVTTGKKTYKATKSLSEIRPLDDDIKQLTPNFNAPLPPIWADRYYASANLNQRRAMVLQAYLTTVSRANPLLQYALMMWLKPGCAFAASDNVKADYRQRIAGKTGRLSMNLAFNNVRPLARIDFDWTPRDAVELQLVEGEIVAILTTKTISEGWWEGETADGQTGLFPSNYISPLSDQQSRNIVLGTYSPSKKPAPAPKTTGRGKKKETKYACPSIDAFDELLQDGFAVLSGKNRFQSRSRSKAVEGDEVEITFSAYIWNCQEQAIFEFASSDLPDKNGNTGPLKFVLGQGQVVQGLEKAIECMGQGDSARVIIAPEMGYGDVGKPPDVAPSAHLIYDVVVEKVSTASLPGPPSDAVATMNMYGGAHETMDDLAAAYGYSARAGARTTRGAWAPVKDISKRNRAPRGTNAGPPSMKPAQGGYAAPRSGGANKFDLKTLQIIHQKQQWQQNGIDPSFIENYLTDADFKMAFRMNKPKFLEQPRWLQQKLKKDVNLG